MRSIRYRTAVLLVASAGVAGLAAPTSVQAEPAPFGAGCLISLRGSHTTATCHNRYVGTDRVALHVECARWWDIDMDSAPVEVGPAQSVRLTGRCWKEISSVWVTHRRAD
ncbi:hypothetical protein ACIPW9_05485 [Streptomyces sp. NPDC090052]|uniref:hypothetical protein n=1 Tax=unclassified Streptomyces TaxID=2593676 RepID=UPI00225C0E13|nr:MULTISPECIES: hypothetical protein [unclassified Streptomyces]MCX4727404.1 hypothetical protein [Streptomyces sp. NBC_01306]WSV03360.1 hypothetical protein OG372_07050 [Streptomyces sp. NBC_01020]WSX41391.1 hypothetical protein OG760_06585 [Streptomyces sp. NBC_00963]